jgi:transcriptional regulator with XRE-family HTH domain
MSPRESEKLIAELRAWCQEKYGRQTEVAKALGVSKGTVNHWLSGHVPSYDKGLALAAFLEQRRRSQRPSSS